MKSNLSIRTELSALLSTLILILTSANILNAGPSVHIKDLVKMSEAQLDQITKSGSITITGVSSWLTRGGIDAIEIEKQDIYEVTDPRVTNFSVGQELTSDDFKEANDHYKNFGGFGYDRSVGYAGLNGLNVNFFGFKPMENKIIIDPAEDKMYYSSTILIPVLPGKDDFKMKTVAVEGNPFSFLEQGLQLEAGPNGKLEFSKVKISLPDMELPAVTISGVVMEISKDSFSMEGEIGDLAAFKKTKPNLSLSAGIEYANGGLNKIAMGASGLQLAMGASGAYFQDINGELGNLTKPKAPWYFNGSGLISYGPNPIKLFGNNYYLASATGGFGFNQNGRVELSARASVLSFDISKAKFVYNPPSSFFVDVNGVPIGAIFRGDLDLTVHNRNVRGNIHAKMGVPRGVPIIGGWNLGGVKAGVTYVENNYFEIRGSVYVTITPEVKSYCWSDCLSGSWPHLHGCGWRGCSWHTHRWKKCWKVCTPRIPAIKASVGFSYHSKRSPSFKAWKAGVMDMPNNYYEATYPWEIPFVYWVKDAEAPGWWVFNQNWDILWAKTERGGIGKQGPGEDKEIDINVTSQIDTAVFRLNYESENIKDINAALILPDGKILNLKDGPFPLGFTAQGITGAAAHNPEGREVFFMIYDVKPGTYKMVVENPEKLGGIRTELSSQTKAPEAAGAIDNQVAKGGEIQPGSYEIAYFADGGASEDAEITFMIDKNNSGNDGIKVGGGKLADFNQDEPYKFDTDHLPDVRPGYYYGLIAVDDGRNPVLYAYTDSPIWVDRDGAPKPITSVRTRAGNNKIIVEWDEPEGDFSHYNVHLSKSENFEINDHSILVEKGKNSTIINGLENGQPYMVSVSSVDENYFESAMMEIHRVTPTQIPGSTKPVIISEPVLTATAGYNYTYLPIKYDADEHNSYIRAITKKEDSELAKTPMIWSLVQAPAGMKINADLGLIEWTPNDDQVGSHNIIVAATENVEDAETISSGTIVNASAIQEYELVVAPKWNISGVNDSLYIASIPELTAVAGSPYKYSPMISSNEEFEIEILSAPHGVEVKDNSIIWNTPLDANGGYIHYRVLVTDTGEEIEHRYFVHVESNSNRVYVGAELVKIEKIGDKILLGWTGDAKKFQIQKTTTLTGVNNWINVGDHIEGNHVNFISLDSTEEDAEYYRIKVLD